MAAPGALLRRTGGPADDDAGARRVVRLLGVRHLAQSGWELLDGRPTSANIGAAIDALHGASMAGLAVVSRRLRRPAALDAALAAVLGVAGLVGGRRCGVDGLGGGPRRSP